jgi:hypothetical protein
MLVIKVELHSAVTREVKTIATAHIVNEGTGTELRGNYRMWLMGKNCRAMTDVRITNWPRKSKHVWQLISRMLKEIYPK